MDAGSVGLKSRWNAIDEELDVILLVLTAIEPSDSAGKDISTSFIQNGRETEILSVRSQKNACLRNSIRKCQRSADISNGRSWTFQKSGFSGLSDKTLLISIIFIFIE